MEKLTVIEKLDSILNYLYDNDREEIDNNKIIADLKIIDQYELIRLVNRLKEDGYVISAIYYSLSVNGYVLRETGGIKSLIAQRKTELQYYEDEKIRRAKVEDEVVANARRLNNLTLGLLIATACACLFALVALMLPYILCRPACSN